MQTNDSINIQSFERNEILDSDLNIEISEDQEEITLNRTKWCVISWTSFIFLVFSIVGVVYSIKYINDYYNLWQCLILSQCIFMLLLSMIGVCFSVQACQKMRSFPVICLCQAYNNIQ
ncbi:Hypothetical_protein [Hexamita inflata]|uniref:Hypothetical_protein n=1 Tax=Hexamita inflata TaxID=28002 RepID=A0AA86R122_9EUKA|nr:Hypothetical protein HINF_LOCUS57306 [Hexamita inflata]